MGETYFIRKKKESNYTQIDNTCVKDERLSWKEKGLHTYLMTLPGDWKIYVSELVRHSRDGKSALYSAIQTLEIYGYIKRIRNRDENGRFEETVYYVYEEPSQADDNTPLSNNPNMENPNVVKPDMENPNKEKRDSENRTLLNTNKLITNDIQNTELTNYKPAESEQKKSEAQSKTERVSESDFVIKIKGLFNGDYPFDKNFEHDVMTKLSEFKISEECIGDYLSYVFERTKIANPTKSFEGLYRTLALSSSVARDFVNCSLAKKNNNVASAENKIIYIDCPVCGNKFDRYIFNCPKCNASVDDIEKHDERNLEITKRLYQMPSEQRDAYYQELEKRSMATQRKFLTTEERNQLYRDFGLID